MFGLQVTGGTKGYVLLMFLLSFKTYLASQYSFMVEKTDISREGGNLAAHRPRALAQRR